MSGPHLVYAARKRRGRPKLYARTINGPTLYKGQAREVSDNFLRGAHIKSAKMRSNQCAQARSVAVGSTKSTAGSSMDIEAARKWLPSPGRAPLRLPPGPLCLARYAWPILTGPL